MEVSEADIGEALYAFLQICSEIQLDESDEQEEKTG
jgi:hypothetical protein